MLLRVEGEWMTMSIGAVHYTMQRGVDDLSGRFGFFMSSLTRAKEPIRIRGLSVSSKSGAAKGEASDADRAERALTEVVKSGKPERALRLLWRLQRGTLSAGGTSDKRASALRKKIAKALLRHDPLELKPRQSGAAVRRALSPIAKIYERKKWFGAARDAWRCVVEADARNARRDLERLAAATPKPAPGSPSTGAAKPASKLQSLSAEDLLKDSVYPWSKASWPLRDGVLTAPKPGVEAQALL